MHEAHDTVLERKVALKVLPEKLVADPDRRARMLREARAAAAVTHPNIAVVHEVGSEDGTVFVAMELVEGESLSAVMARGSLSLADALKIMAQIAQALAKAHSAGVLHRDLKPQNVMIDESGRAKLLDFGLAKVMTPVTEIFRGCRHRIRSDRSGAGDGNTGIYGAEQAEGRQVDERADVFSLGAMLYELIERRPAFDGIPRLQRIAATLRDEPAP